MLGFTPARELEINSAMQFTIYHNPRCSKSRQTLQILEDNGISPEIVLYLQSPPKAQKIASLAEAIGIDPRDLIRKGEAIYKELGVDAATTSDDVACQLIHDYPKLLERPIVERSDGKAILGRPPENVLELITPE